MAFVMLWRMRLMGAGDVKYLAVLGLAIGAWPWLLVLVLAGRSPWCSWCSSWFFTAV
ncbi:type 4 prepilin leader peptidase [Bordetella pertussis]|nr:type 4 prepilin leader peptidase [Bordetella pertussis]